MNHRWLKKLLYALCGAAAALGLLVLWATRPAPVSGFYAGRDFGCMCGPGALEILDGKAYMYILAHETKELLGEYRADGKSGWLNLKGVAVPVRSYNGYIEIATSHRHMRGYRVFYPRAKVARLRAFGTEPKAD